MQLPLVQQAFGGAVVGSRRGWQPTMQPSVVPVLPPFTRCQVSPNPAPGEGEQLRQISGEASIAVG